MDESLISVFKNVSKMEMEKLITGKGGAAKIFTGYQLLLNFWSPVFNNSKKTVKIYIYL